MRYINETDMSNFKKINTSSWETIKDNVRIRLMNHKYVSHYGDIVFRKSMDLAITFSIQEKSKDGSILSHMLTFQDLSNYNISEDELYTVAIHNMGTDRKRRMLTVKEHMLSKNTLYPLLKVPHGSMLALGMGQNDMGIIEEETEDGTCNVLVLTNKQNVFGAGYMLVPEILRNVYEKFDYENFYILPMSVHYVICVRSGYVTDEGEKPFYEVEDDLLDTIEQINENTEESWENILSYRIYYYLGDDGNRLMAIK